MAIQTAIWTLLPNGVTAKGDLKVSALVSPRLSLQGEPPVLGEFNAFVDWPEQLRQATFKVYFDGQILSTQPFASLDPEALDPGDDRSSPDSALWTALFPPETYVRSHAFEDLSTNVILSYPTQHLLSFIEDFYGNLAVSVWNRLPQVHELPELDGKNLIREFSETPTLEDREGLINQRKKDFLSIGTVPPRPKRNLQSNFRDFSLYHMPSGELKTLKKASSAPTSEAEWQTVVQEPLPQASDFSEGIGDAERFRLDFHQIVSSLTQYPSLLRRLGLVVDLLIPRPKGLGDVADGLLWLDVEWSQGAVPLTNMPQPRTHAQLKGSRFAALPKSSDSGLIEGLLSLEQKRFNVIQLDPAGSIMKLSNFARSSFAARNPQTEGETTGVPALRGTTISIIETGRAVSLSAKLKKSTKLNDDFETNTPLDLCAEDLQKGLRIDVLDRGIWRSLCQRLGRYQIKGLSAPLLIEDENSIQMGVTTATDRWRNPQSDQLYLGETLFNWGGWSLAAPRPGATVDPEDEVTSIPDDVNEQRHNPAPEGMRLAAEFQVKPRSLPRLRYGQSYQFRARLTDLAGNSLAPTTREIGSKIIRKQTVSKALHYLRFEPIPSPAMALVLAAGQQLSDLSVAEGESMERLAIRNFNDTALFAGDANAADLAPSPQVAERHIVPPRIAQAEAERHGVVDDVTGNPDKQRYAQLVTQDTPLPEHIITRPAPRIEDNNTIQASYSYGEENLSLSYLPDPLARGVAIRYLDHPALPPDTTEHYSFNPENQNWPGRQPFRIRVVEGDTLPKFLSPPNGDYVLEVPVPKGEVVRLLLGCYFEESDLDLMGLWSWIQKRAASETALSTIRSDVLQGRHWMLTPWRTIHLVNAVQQPLGVPRILDLKVSRWLNDTGLTLRFFVPLHRKSTMKLEFFADWNEPKDTAQKGELPQNVSREDHAFEIKIRIQDPLDELRVKEIPERHEIGTTGYRKIRYQGITTTRYREYFPKSLWENIESIIRRSQPAIGVAQNSARPPAPEILYVVPTYGWTKSEEAGGQRHDRRGGGLRIYLDRPWYVTGYGEMLAVVVPKPRTPRDTVDGALKPFVTQWGQDPIWKTGAIRSTSPDADNSDFPLAVFTAAETAAALNEADIPEDEKLLEGVTDFNTASLSLAELEGHSVSVAPHVVAYDPERELWYCDIEVRANQSYTPFIRLALARYHPVSNTNAHLSAVVQAEFTQLAPDRSAVLTSISGSSRTFRLRVHGRRPQESSAAAALKRGFPYAYINGEFPLEEGDLPQSTVVKVSVEKLDPSLGSDFGWSRDSSVKIKRYKLRRRAMRAVSLSALPELWDGRIDLPDATETPVQYRIVIREYESFIANPHGQKWIERVVYADILNL